VGNLQRPGSPLRKRGAFSEDVLVDGSDLEIQEEAGGQVLVVVRGRLDFRTAKGIRERLTSRFAGRAIGSLTIDMSAVGQGDTSGLVVLHELKEGDWAHGIRARIVGLHPELSRILSAFPADRGGGLAVEAPRPNVAEVVGQRSIRLVRGAREHVHFIGAVVQALGQAILRPRRMRWREVARVFEKAGVDALPVLSLVSGLFGINVALEGAQPLARFGAEIFTASIIGRTVVREMGPLLAAFVLAGRSGSAFAAELGTMKVNDELDALVTMGLDPVRFLVVQRVLASTLLAPLLAVYSIAVGIAAGVLIMGKLGFSPTVTWSVLTDWVTLKDVLLGISKSVIYGAAVAGIGCERGLQTENGASSVGASATRAVVGGIILIVAVDAMFAVVAYAMKI
jgi:phospholipid/cholesterol/gamma-HCH transport system permease protein